MIDARDSIAITLPRMPEWRDSSARSRRQSRHRACNSPVNPRSGHASIRKSANAWPRNRTKYVYDNANQLASITYTKGATTIGDLQYTYDNAGRRTKVAGSLAASDLPAAVASASYNAKNQITTWGGATYTYDLNGNVTGNGIMSTTWDARNQLASLSGTAAASFAYDGAGRRKSKAINGTQTGFLYDGVNFVQELTGTTPKANLITGGIDELFQRKESATTRYPITDALGSPIALTDSTGALSTQYSFEPYGTTIRTGAADTNSQTYTGREDDGTGLFYYRARYYAPSQGRFTSEDPLGILGGSNVYAYAANDPISLADPLGLWSLSVSSYAGLGGGVTVSGEGIIVGAITFEGGVGLGGGVGFDWGGGAPDGHAGHDSNSFGGVAGVSGGVLVWSRGMGVNYGGTIDCKGNVHDYGGLSPETTWGKPHRNRQGGFSFKLEGRVGVQLTHNF